MAAPKEAYAPDHKRLDDAALLAPPAGAPFTPLTLFVCTYVAKLANLHISFVELTRIMCARPHGCLLAVNSNFGHAAQPGAERHLKSPKPPAPRQAPSRGRPRKVQGDGTCFNSAIEPVVAVGLAGLAPGKVYYVKCFPTTGETQVPGVVLPDLSDGHAVLAAFVAYLNELGVGDAAPPAPGAAPGAARPPLAVAIAREQPKMINYKFRLARSSPRILVNLHALAAYLGALEATKLAEGGPAPTPAQLARFAAWPALVLPPHPVRETKSPTDDVKVSFRFREPARAPRLNVFQEGKVNILGADSVMSAERIYDFFTRLFAANWAALVTLQPRRDLERRPPPPPPAPPPPHAPPLSDAAVDALLADVLGDDPAPAADGALHADAPGGAADDPAPPAALDAEMAAALDAFDVWGDAWGDGGPGPAEN